MKVTNKSARLIVVAVAAATAAGTAILGELRLIPGVNEVPDTEANRAALADVQDVEVEAASDETNSDEKPDPNAGANKAPAATGGKGSKGAAPAPAPTPAPNAAAPAAGAPGAWKAGS